MSWYALTTLDDARRATTSLLLPVDIGRWLRLALIAFFVGGLGGGSGGGGGGQGTVNYSFDEPLPGFVDGVPSVDALPVRSLLPMVAVVLVVLALLGFGYLLVGSVLEFVFVDGVSRRSVRIRAPFREHLHLGLRLFAFRVLVGLLILALVAIPLAGAVLGGVGLSPALFLLALPVLLVVGLVALVVGVVLQLTTDLVVPTMLAEDRGVLDGWQRVYPLLRSEWEQTALYVLVRYALAIGAAIVVGLVVVLLALVVALPFVVVGGVLYVALLSTGGLGTVGWFVLGVVGALYGLSVVVVGLFVQVPVVTYFRYYALFVLGEFDPALDLVASVRADVGDASDRTDATG
ncbi:hypothetical protein SAMN04487948_10982 [Halogranum amylolyticum]|uniref:Membrane domain of glycerophosphoryl diester phosphodiesterase n=1 Tax=Halogranum amylolyticum TaxID=660520 RepID=A0A1H8U337_9EURY|nr:hypothetical protein [Halogranum amylolyticum]SEO97253.1 hypothetical protein SAMN04487948_10982 [Halogranum amylolyticum]